jgi:F0F1-type ATP synthase assembly protein I
MQQLPDEDRRKIGAYLGLGWAFALTTLAFVGLGYLLDRWLGAAPIFTVVGMLVGGAAGFYYLVRQALEIQKGDAGNKDDGSTRPSRETRDGK